MTKGWIKKPLKGLFAVAAFIQPPRKQRARVERAWYGDSWAIKRISFLWTFFQ